MDHDRTMQDAGDGREAHRTARRRWAAVGAAIAIAVGGGGLFTASAADSPPSSPGSYVGITPCRVIDTRPGGDNVGPRSTPIGAGETFTTPFTGTVGKCTIPASAIAVVLNVAVVNPSANSFLTVFPGGADKPLAANLNWSAGQPPVSNAVTVRVGDGGKLSFFNLAGNVDVTADVSGYYLPAGGGQQIQMSFAPEALQMGVPAATVNGCVSNLQGNGVNGQIPLSVPSGATVTAFAVSAWGSGGNTWQAKLMRRSPAATGYQATQVFSTLGGNLTGQTQSQISTGSVVSGQEDTWYIDVNLGGNFAVGICRVRLHYTMP